MATFGYTDRKQDIVKRLSRAEGQVRGVSKMVQADTYCIDVLTQITAAKAALDKVAIELIRDHAGHCLSSDGDQKTTEHKADELARAISRLV